MVYKSISNISDDNAIYIAREILVIFRKVYKRIPSKKIIFKDLQVTTPVRKSVTYNMDDYKNIRKILYYIFANINNRSFTKNFNENAYNILVLILYIFDRDNNKIVNRGISSEIMSKNIEFGKYIFNIPKKFKYIFQVDGYKMAKLNII